MARKYRPLVPPDEMAEAIKKVPEEVKARFLKASQNVPESVHKGDCVVVKGWKNCGVVMKTPFCPGAIAGQYIVMLIHDKESPGFIYTNRDDITEIISFEQFAARIFA